MMLKSTRLLLCERATDIGEDKVRSAPNKQGRYEKLQSRYLGFTSAPCSQHFSRLSAEIGLHLAERECPKVRDDRICTRRPEQSGALRMSDPHDPTVEKNTEWPTEKGDL